MRIKKMVSVAFVAAVYLQGSGVSAQGVAVTTPVPFIRWEPIREADIAWKKRVWRDMDAKDNAQLFGTAVKEGDGSKAFINVLLDGIKDGTLQAYSPLNDSRFLDKYSYEEIKAQLNDPTLVTVTKNTETGKEIYNCAGSGNIAAVQQYRLKEDWLFMADKKKMVVRIVGIAPIVKVMGDNGEAVDQPLFWVYYPDNRGYFASYLVPATDDAAPTMTWDEFFEGRFFNSTVTRVVETNYVKRQK